MQVVLFLLLCASAFAQELTFNTGSDWELKKNLFSADYAVVYLETSNALLVKKMPAEITNADVESELKKEIEKKSKSQVPWINSSIKSVQDIEWFPGKTGKLMTVEHLKRNIPHTSIVGIQPLQKEHYFIFYSEETLQFAKHEKDVLELLNSIKGH
jgi:hypothetical protein